jgi:oxygen-independent coproporphyrinogen-3 oxidase
LPPRLMPKSWLPLIPGCANIRLMNSVYIHIPFCLAKCGYCGFNSRPLVSDNEAGDYCSAMMKEIANCKLKNDDWHTVYFGGGTPSLLSAWQIKDVLGTITKNVGPLGDDCEATIEANPGTVDLYKLSDLREAGFNRISLGVQSFDGSLLKLMGRCHTPQQSLSAFGEARQAGFRNISLDLIFALPGQSLENWRADLDQLLDLGPEHVSLYSLSYEPGTEFSRRKAEGLLLPVAEELEEEMYLAAIGALESAGYDHYEVSNFAKRGFRSRHNLNYWQGGNYLGVGAGAHSHLEGKRWSNLSDPGKYSAALENGESPVEMEETLTREQRIFEAIFLGLRMVEGIAVGEFEKKWGLAPAKYLPKVWRKLEENYYLENEGGRLRLNREGLLLSDTLLADFAP